MTLLRSMHCSAGAAPWLSKNVLGVSPLTPGYASVLVSPHLSLAMASSGGLSGSVPTSHGPVTLAVGVSSASEIEVTLPVGCHGGGRLELSRVLLARLGWLPSALADAAPPLLVNGQPAPSLRFDGLRGPLADEARPASGRCGVWAIDLLPGANVVTLLASATHAALRAPADPFPPLSWSGRFMGEDVTTQGNWIGRFGSAGFVLFDFNTSGTVQVSDATCPLGGIAMRCFFTYCRRCLHSSHL